MDDFYKTIKCDAACEITEKHSRFIGSVHPVSDELSAVAFINSLKTKYWDARHNVYAYILRSGNTARYSDDSEPQGTAGVPVLEVLKKNELCDCVLVVTRYFGGVLLGTGGLIRAYSSAASLAVKTAGIAVMKKCFVCELACDYNQYGRLPAVIEASGGKVFNADFGSVISLSFYIPAENYDRFSAKLCDFFCGNITSSVTKEQFCCLD